ncbi:helix-turn-helix domain-containing protein [Legionella shakespearei]|uniref:Transcriptional regulator, crp family n=1 Tax=Legionella shakespearei DSM 23087 TaxID=1122169 RepID=A0A0W0Z2S6_9GAMM|nr:helix-turn-helix domain-containing protein [Legionella shakespearei]KTD63456.1 transcriptional regulator, crp family [Legionella shakespearei DSM 23087]
MYNKDTQACSYCGFASFCTLDVQGSQWVNQVNPAVSRQHVLKKNLPLYVPQTSFHSLYVIKSGCLKTYEIDKDGNELLRGFYFPGEILGLEAIAGGHYLYSTAALSNALVCEISYTHFCELLRAHPGLQQQVLYLVSQQLGIGSYLNFVTAEQRLAAFLIDLSKRLVACEQRLEFVLPMSRQDIGNYLRLTAETVSRLFTQFRNNEIISVEHKKIRLLQLDQLKSIGRI